MCTLLYSRLLSHCFSCSLCFTSFCHSETLCDSLCPNEAKHLLILHIHVTSTALIFMTHTHNARSKFNCVSLPVCVCVCMRHVQAESPVEITECWLWVSSVQLYLLPVSQAFRLSSPLAKAQLWCQLKHFLAPHFISLQAKAVKMLFTSCCRCFIGLLLNCTSISKDILLRYSFTDIIGTAFLKLPFISGIEIEQLHPIRKLRFPSRACSCFLWILKVLFNKSTSHMKLRPQPEDNIQPFTIYTKEQKFIFTVLFFIIYMYLFS